MNTKQKDLPKNAFFLTDSDDDYTVIEDVTVQITSFRYLADFGTQEHAKSYDSGDYIAESYGYSCH